jgi:hypothetical protein
LLTPLPLGLPTVGCAAAALLLAFSGATTAPSGAPGFAVSLPCGVASGALLTSRPVAMSTGLGVVSCAACSAVSGDGDGACAALLAVAAVEIGAVGTVAGVLSCGRSMDGWTAAFDAASAMSIFTVGAAGAACAGALRLNGTASSSASATSTAGACTCGLSTGTAGVGTLNCACRFTLGDGCAGNGTGCSSGTGGATGSCARAGITLAGDVVFGTSAFSAKLDTVMGGDDGADTSGSASEAGGTSGWLPSSCGLRTDSGWNFGGTGGCSAGVGSVTDGGSAASGMGCSSGAGEGCGRLAGGGGAATGFGAGACGFALAMTGGAAAGGGCASTTACV